MTKCKVLIVQPMIPLYRAQFFEELAATEQLDVLVLADLKSKNQLNQYDPNRYKFVAGHLPLVNLGPLTFRFGLFRYLKRFRPDVVVFNGNPRDVTQMAAMAYCKLIGIPFCVWSMFYRIGPRRVISSYLYKYMGLVGGLLLSYGERGYKELVQLGISPKKIVILHNSINEIPIKKIRDQIRNSDVEQFIKAEGVAGKRILLQVVRMTSIKRTDILLRAYALLAERRHDTVLILIGGGNLEKEMKDLAEQLGVAHSVRFVGPLYDEAKLALWYKAADIFVMATCIGLSIHHAMAYGVPVITDDNQDTQTAEFEVLKDGVNGFTYESGNILDFVEKIIRVLDDVELRKYLSRNAIQRIEEDYSIHKMLSRFVQSIHMLNGCGRKSFNIIPGNDH